MAKKKGEDLINKYELEVEGIGEEQFKLRTNNITKALAEVAQKLKDDIYLGGVKLILREGNITSEVTLPSYRLKQFKVNADTRMYTETYLTDQLNQLKELYI